MKPLERIEKLINHIDGMPKMKDLHGDMRARCRGYEIVKSPRMYFDFFNTGEMVFRKCQSSDLYEAHWRGGLTGHASFLWPTEAERYFDINPYFDACDFVPTVLGLQVPLLGRVLFAGPENMSSQNPTYESELTVTVLKKLHQKIETSGEASLTLEYCNRLWDV